MTKKIRLAAIYGRKSRENAKTLEGQINSCLDWVIKFNANNKTEEIKVVEIFEEEGSASSEDWNRPKLQDMLIKIKRLDFHIIITSEQTRISRTEDFSIFKKYMKNTKTIFVTADTDNIYDFNKADDAFKSGALQLFGELELSTSKTRLKRGTIQSAKNGNYQGKKPPAGYEYDPSTKRLKKTVEADHIKKIFELYAEGMSTVDISYKYNQENVIVHHKKKGQMVPITFSKSTVARMLKNIHYAGHTLFGKTEIQRDAEGNKIQVANKENHLLIENTHEPIVSQELWDKVQARLAKNRTVPPALKKVKHKFSGLVACRNCGKHHSFELDNYGHWRISSCQARVYNEDCTSYRMCGNSGVRLDYFESAFWIALAETKDEIITHIDLIKNSTVSNKEMRNIKTTQKKSKQLQIQQIKKKRKRIADYLEEGDFYEPEEIPEKEDEVKRLAKQIKAIEQEIIELDQQSEENETEGIERIVNKMEGFLSGEYKNLDKKEANKILSEFIKDIVYTKPKGQTKFTIDILMKDYVNEFLNEVKKNLNIA